LSSIDSGRVADLLVELGSELVMPRFRSLRQGDVHEKAPGDLVTIVDHEVERELSGRLPELVPGSRVVGEEGVAQNPRLLAGIGEGWVWVVDPLDGTVNFVEGRPHFALMVGLLRNGEPVGAWIHSPPTGSMAVAESGAGATLNGARLSLYLRTTGLRTTGEPVGIAMTRYLPPDVRATWERGSGGRDFGQGTGSAAIDYLALARGQWDFLFYWRTYPWDHVPGSLLVREAGGHVARPDGTPYRPDDGRFGLLIANSLEVWNGARVPGRAS
jgi:fructose-1,6-bisphosphatase/inositol monophosphatase family enzyme